MRAGVHVWRGCIDVEQSYFGDSDYVDGEKNKKERERERERERESFVMD